MGLFNGQHNFSAFTTKVGREEMKKYGQCPVKTVKISKLTLKIDLLFIRQKRQQTAFLAF